MLVCYLRVLLFRALVFPPLRLANEVIRIEWIKYELTVCSVSKYTM